MAALTRPLVDIPGDKGVYYNETAGAKNEKYIYKYVKYYRNKNGKRIIKAKAIGKLNVITGKIHSNTNYYEIYRVAPFHA